MASEVVIIPATLTNPNEILVKLTIDQYYQIQGSLEALRKRREASRKTYETKNGLDKRPTKLVYQLGPLIRPERSIILPENQ